MGDKCKLMRPKARRVGDKAAHTCLPEWETSVGDKCKLMRPKSPRVGEKGETSVNSCGPLTPRVGDKLRGDKCKPMRP